MKAAKLTEHPSFRLMRQTDVQNVWHMQMPRWLFSDLRYADMSLDAKVTYTFLLNRFQLSRRNGWINDDGEVFVIFPRKALAKELRICEQRVTAAFRKLAELQLIWEKRCGRGDANQIYLARVTPIEDPDYSCAPFITEDESEVRGSRTSDLEGLADGKPSAACQEPQNLLSKNREDRASRTAKSAFPEPQKLTPSKKEKRKIDCSQIEVSPYVLEPAHDGLTDEEREDDFLNILDACELTGFTPGTALVFENAIERLYYSDSYRIGNATLPQSRVRAKLRRLDGMILLAFLLGFPANEIVLPILLMGYSSAGTLVDGASLAELKTMLQANGWTGTTALCMLLFSLFHFPCGTTTLTLARESKSLKWTLVGVALPTAVGMTVCFAVHLAATWLKI